MAKKRILEKITRDNYGRYSLKMDAPVDIEEYKTFLAHECDHVDNSGDVTESYTYHFTETSVGTALEISCKCGYKRDVTDYNRW